MLTIGRVLQHKSAQITLVHVSDKGTTAREICATPTGLHRPLYAIAADIRANWPNVNYAAAPYLDAMRSLTTVADMYGADNARSIVLYFLANAQGWRGPKAKAVKAELKRICGVKP